MTEAKTTHYGYGAGFYSRDEVNGDISRCHDCGEPAVADLEARHYMINRKLTSITLWAKCSRHAMYARRRKNAGAQEFRVIDR